MISEQLKKLPDFKRGKGSNFWKTLKKRPDFSQKMQKAHVLNQISIPLIRSKMFSVGDEPEGFGAAFHWGREENQALLVVFVNAAGSAGVAIEGLEPWDHIEVTSATGIASFAEETENETLTGLIGLVAIGAEVGSTVAGYPEAIPLIEKAEKYAKEQFKENKVRTKRRDPFGEDPGTGHRARQEGGVLVCMPEAKGIFYSGNGDHEERWIKDHNERTVANLPKHIPVGCAFFLNRNDVNIMQTLTGGEAYIVAWDHSFEDNMGYYKLYVRLSKGVAPPIL